MARTIASRWSVVTAAACLAAALIACGNPEPQRKSFVFTPVPYTVVPEKANCPTCGLGISQTAEGDDYYADQVLLVVERSAEREIVDVLDEYGFQLLVRFENARRGTTSILVQVPLGSAPAALKLLAAQDGVIDADLNGIFRTSRSVAFASMLRRGRAISNRPSRCASRRIPVRNLFLTHPLR